MTTTVGLKEIPVNKCCPDGHSLDAQVRCVAVAAAAAGGGLNNQTVEALDMREEGGLVEVALAVGGEAMPRCRGGLEMHVVRTGHDLSRLFSFLMFRRT